MKIFYIISSTHVRQQGCSKKAVWEKQKYTEDCKNEKRISTRE